MLRESRLFRGIAIGAIALAVLAFALRALSMVMHGHAADVYVSVRGATIMWSSTLLFFVALVITLSAAILLRPWFLKRRRDLADAKREERRVRQLEARNELRRRRSMGKRS